MKVLLLKYPETAMTIFLVVLSNQQLLRGPEPKNNP